MLKSIFYDSQEWLQSFHQDVWLMFFFFFLTVACAVVGFMPFLSIYGWVTTKWLRISIRIVASALFFFTLFWTLAVTNHVTERKPKSIYLTNVADKTLLVDTVDGLKDKVYFLDAKYKAGFDSSKVMIYKDSDALFRDIAHHEMYYEPQGLQRR